METETKTFPWAITVAKFAAIVLVILLANIGIARLIDDLEIQIWPEYLEIIDRAVLISVILYIALMATPFLPGIEIGLTLMAVLGPKGALLIYLSTLIALTISFGLGRLFPTHLLVSLLQWLHLSRAATLLKSFDAIPPRKTSGISC